MVNIPNLITAMRGLSVPVFIMLLHYSKSLPAMVLFILASISDALDGFLARKLNKITKVGVIIDPLADKALINSGFIMLSMVKNVIPVWLTILVVSRDVMILIGGWLFATFGKLEKIKPSIAGKITALSQFITILAGLCQINGYINQASVEIISYTTGTLTIISAIDYSIKGVKELNG